MLLASGQKVPRIINIKEGGAAGECGQLRVGQLITAVEGRSTEGDQNPSYSLSCKWCKAPS